MDGLEYRVIYLNAQSIGCCTALTNKNISHKKTPKGGENEVKYR